MTTASAARSTAASASVATERVPSWSRQRRWRLAAGVAAVVAAALLLAGCGGVLGSFLTVRTDLQSQGFRSVNINSTNQTIRVQATLPTAPDDADVGKVARAVWDGVPYRFDLLEVTVTGAGRTDSGSFTFDTLRQALGARDPSFDQTSLTRGTVGLVLTIFGIVAAVFVVLLAVVVVIVVSLTRRSRRKRLLMSGSTAPYFPAPPPPWSPPGAAGPGWSPPGSVGQPPGWAPPSPSSPYPPGQPPPAQPPYTQPPPPPAHGDPQQGAPPA